jgi:hypothetical protein
MRHIWVKANQYVEVRRRREWKESADRNDDGDRLAWLATGLILLSAWRGIFP